MRHRSASIRNFAFAAAVGLAIKFSAFADFTLDASAGVFKTNEKLVLSQSDLDTRKEINVATFAANPDGSLNQSISSEAAVFDLTRHNDEKIPFAVANGQTIAFHGSREILVKGSPETDKLNQYETFRKASLARLVYSARQDIKTAKSRGATAIEIERLTQAEVDAYAAHLRELNDFAIDHVGSSTALYATSLRWTGDYRIDELDATVAEFIAKHGEIQIAQSMRERLDRFSKVALGKTAPELEGENLASQHIALSSLRGKYVLVDFWASWCPPCRLENKVYKTLKQKYAGKNFEIFAINLDKSRSLWSRASKQDAIDWIQISDLQGWQSDLAVAYNVAALPASFLLDPEGRIIAKNLRGSILEEKLAHYLE